jgi:hypothetical protein
MSYQPTWSQITAIPVTSKPSVRMRACIMSVSCKLSKIPLVVDLNSMPAFAS